MTALDMVMTALEAAAGSVVAEYRGNRYTGAALLGRMRGRANDLHGAGLRDGDTALIIVRDNLSAIEQLVACWMIGASGCLVDFRSPPARLAEWAARLSPRLVIGVAAGGMTGMHVQPRDPTPGETLDFVPATDPHRAATHIASSGSTGLPKLATHLQDRLAVHLTASAARARGEGRGVTLSAISVGYSASYFLWLTALTAGQPIVALDLVHRLEELDAALRRPDVRECSLAPALVRRLAGLPGPTPRYPNLDALISVGGPALAADKRAAVERLTPNYRMTYSCVGLGMISRIIGAEVLERPASCGRPFEGVTVTIRNGERLCAPGEIGAIIVSNASLSEARPGDLGYLDADGYLYVTGRVEGLICRNGVNFSAERLTTVALGLPEIIDAAVVLLPDADGGDTVHLVVQGPASIAPALDAMVREALPISEHPDRIHLRASMPMTPSGKIDMRALSEDIASVVARHVA